MPKALDFGRDFQTKAMGAVFDPAKGGLQGEALAAYLNTSTSWVGNIRNGLGAALSVDGLVRVLLAVRDPSTDREGPRRVARVLNDLFGFALDVLVIPNPAGCMTVHDVETPLAEASVAVARLQLALNGVDLEAVPPLKADEAAEIIDEAVMALLQTKAAIDLNMQRSRR